MNKLEKAAEYYAKEIHFNQFCELCVKYRGTVAYHDLTKYHRGIIDGIDKICRKAFIAGTKWQEEQSAGKEQDSMLAASLIGADMAKPKWKKTSIDDNSPITGKWYLLRVEWEVDGQLEVFYITSVWGEYGWSEDYLDKLKDYEYRITHYMPIPEPPKGGEE